MARIWIDIEDLLEYAAANRRPSGIQRLSYELCKAMNAACAGQDRIRFLRHDRRRGSFAVVAWAELEAAHAALTGHAGLAAPAARRPPRGAGGTAAPAPPLLGRRRILQELRLPIGAALRFQQLATLAALAQAGRAAGWAVRALRQPKQRQQIPPPPAPPSPGRSRRATCSSPRAPPTPIRTTPR